MSYLAYFGWLLRDAILGEHVPREDVEYVSVQRALVYLAVGVVGIGLLSKLVVESSLFITDYFGLAESVFALLVIAIGTSVPDLFASMSAAERGYGSMAMSNAVGSNVFDILVGLGLPLSILASSTPVAGTISTSVVLLLASIALAVGLTALGFSIVAATPSHSPGSTAGASPCCARVWCRPGSIRHRGRSGGKSHGGPDRRSKRDGRFHDDRDHGRDRE